MADGGGAGGAAPPSVPAGSSGASAGALARLASAKAALLEARKRTRDGLAKAQPAPPAVALEPGDVVARAREHARMVAAALARRGVVAQTPTTTEKRTTRDVAPGIKPVHDAAAAAAAAEAAQAAEAEREAERRALEGDPRFFDPDVGPARRRPRVAKFSFVKPGVFQAVGERKRLQKRYGRQAAYELAQREREQGGAAAVSAPMDADGVVDDKAQVPAVEWWDALVLPEGAVSYPEPGADVELRADAITHYIEHPVELDPPLEAPPPPPQPLRLTERERKKLRRQRREAKEKERRQLVAEGLLEPPKPRVKLSNMMSVLGGDKDSSAVYDPTRVEREIAKARDERMMAHEDRNLANALTPEERRERTLARLLGTKRGDGGDVAAVMEKTGTPVSVYRIGRVSHTRNPLSDGRTKYKVTMNAAENHLTGIALLVGGLVLVVVEGLPKSQKRYKKLMLNRIRWNKDEDDEDDEDAGAAAAPAAPGADALAGAPVTQADHLQKMGIAGLMRPAGAPPPRERVTCECVWEGVEPRPAFTGKFRVEAARDEADARALMERAGVARYLDLALASAVAA